MITRTLSLVFALLLLSCDLATEPRQDLDPSLDGDAQSAIVLRAEKTEYAHGDTAMFVLRNESDKTIGYNLCNSARELRTGNTWKRYETLRICVAAFFNLAPRAEATHREPISPEWDPGEYRLVTTVIHPESNSHREVFSSTFTVRR